MGSACASASGSLVSNALPNDTSKPTGVRPSSPSHSASRNSSTSATKSCPSRSNTSSDGGGISRAQHLEPRSSPIDEPVGGLWSGRAAGSGRGNAASAARRSRASPTRASAGRATRPHRARHPPPESTRGRARENVERGTPPRLRVAWPIKVARARTGRERGRPPARSRHKGQTRRCSATPPPGGLARAAETRSARPPPRLHLRDSPATTTRLMPRWPAIPAHAISVCQARPSAPDTTAWDCRSACDKPAASATKGTSPGIRECRGTNSSDGLDLVLGAWCFDGHARRERTPTPRLLRCGRWSGAAGVDALRARSRAAPGLRPRPGRRGLPPGRRRRTAGRLETPACASVDTCRWPGPRPIATHAEPFDTFSNEAQRHRQCAAKCAQRAKLGDRRLSARPRPARRAHSPSPQTFRDKRGRRRRPPADPPGGRRRALG